MPGEAERLLLVVPQDRPVLEIRTDHIQGTHCTFCTLSLTWPVETEPPRCFTQFLMPHPGSMAAAYGRGTLETAFLFSGLNPTESK